MTESKSAEILQNRTKILLFKSRQYAWSYCKAFLRISRGCSNPPIYTYINRPKAEQLQPLSLNILLFLLCNKKPFTFEATKINTQTLPKLWTVLKLSNY